MSTENNLPDNPNVNVEGLKPFKKLCITIGTLPSSYMEAMSYQELLLWLCDYLKNTVIPAFDNNANAVTELQNLYIELKNYVDNYFTNLDVQEEINKKLDDMAEDGTLQNIISQFLKLSSLLSFDTVESLKNSNNLINGSYACTLGFYNINDGGKAFYKIENLTTNDIIDNITIIPLKNNLIAKLISNGIVNIKQFGAYGDGEHDDTQNIQKAIDYAYNLENNNFYNSLKIIVPKGKYLVTSQLTFKSSTLNGSELSNIIVEGEGQGTTCFIGDFSANGNVFYLNSSSKFTLKDLSIKNITENFDITGVKIDNSSMVIDLTNIFIYKCYIGFDVNICVGNITNCFANSCNCGFKVKGTSTNINNCYASQCTKKSNDVNDYNGCGFFFDTHYSNVNSCGSDSNNIAYYIIRNGISLNNCGMEQDDEGIIINLPNSNIYQAPIIINGYLYDNITKPTIKIKNAQKVIIQNHNFSLDFDYVEINENLPANVVEYNNCNFYNVNESLYPNNLLQPINNRSRKNGTIYNFDGYVNEGKSRLYNRELKWRIPKNKLSNGRKCLLEITAKTLIHYNDNTYKTFLEKFAINYIISNNYIAKTLPNYNETNFDYSSTSDDNYNYYTLKPKSSEIVPDNNRLIYDINIYDTSKLNLNDKNNIFIEIEGLDY